MNVAGPAQALVALGAIGRDIETVAAHPPYHIFMETVDQWIRTFEPPGALQIGVADHGAEVVDVMEPPFPAVAAGDDVRAAVELLVGDRQALLVTEHGRPVGLVTRTDLLEALAR